MLYLLAHKQTARFFQPLGEEVEVDYLRFTAGVGVSFSRRMRATLGLACAQAATLCTQVVGHTRSRRSCHAMRDIMA